MAEEAEQKIEDIGDEEPETTPGYKPPAQKSLDEIQNLDADDESLVRYKKALLAGASSVLDEGGNNVLVKKMHMITSGRDDIVLELTGDLSSLKSKPITIKEGVEYQIAVVFRVQREIVAGLRYHQVTYRKGVKVDKESYMVGSYGPKTEEHKYVTPKDEAPKGMLARGHYTVKSKFLDDDKIVYLDWEWSFDIKKDWD